MEMRRWRMAAVAMLAFGLLAVACGSGGGGDSASPSGGGGATSVATAAGGQTVTIKDLAFDPSTLTVSPGTMTITVTNDDSVTHTFTLDDGSVSQPIPAGQTVTVSVDITKTTGFHCTIHPTMTGTLKVA